MSHQGSGAGFNGTPRAGASPLHPSPGAIASFSPLSTRGSLTVLLEPHSSRCRAAHWCCSVVLLNGAALGSSWWQKGIFPIFFFCRKRAFTGSTAWNLETRQRRWWD